jgi:hypothetical protein
MKTLLQNRLLQRFAVLSAFLLISFPANSQEEKTLSGLEISVVLSDARVKGVDFQQSFGTPDGETSASTTYWQGNNASFGRWRVEGDDYCSQWQQDGPWSCYAVSSFTLNNDTHIIWIDRSGRRYESVLIQP